MNSLTGKPPCRRVFFLYRCMRKRGGENTDKSEKRIRYIGKAADIICRSAYGMCRSVLADGKSKPPDPKELKEVCAAVKEAAAIAAGLEKTENGGAEALSVTMDAVVKELAQ